MESQSFAKSRGCKFTPVKVQTGNQQVKKENICSAYFVSQNVKSFLEDLNSCKRTEYVLKICSHRFVFLETQSFSIT